MPENPAEKGDSRVTWTTKGTPPAAQEFNCSRGPSTPTSTKKKKRGGNVFREKTRESRLFVKKKVGGLVSEEPVPPRSCHKGFTGKSGRRNLPKGVFILEKKGRKGDFVTGQGLKGGKSAKKNKLSRKQKKAIRKKGHRFYTETISTRKKFYRKKRKNFPQSNKEISDPRD